VEERFTARTPRTPGPEKSGAAAHENLFLPLAFLGVLAVLSLSPRSARGNPEERRYLSFPYGRELEVTGRDAFPPGREVEVTGREAFRAGREVEVTGREAFRAGREVEKRR